MVKSIIPVGKSLGPFIKDGEVKHFELHLGNEIEELDVYQIAMWAMARNNHEAQMECRFDRQLLMEEFEKENNTQFESDKKRHIDKLIELGALVEIDLKNDPLESFLSEHMFYPTGHCYGNVGDDTDMYGIGLNDQPRLWVSKWTQVIWASSYRDGPIWNACVEIANRNQAATPLSVARHFVDSLPVLISADLGYLEPK